MQQSYKKNLMISVAETGQESSPRYLPASYLATHPIKQRMKTDHSVLSTNDHLSSSNHEHDISSYSIQALSPLKTHQSPSHSLPYHHSPSHSLPYHHSPSHSLPYHHSPSPTNDFAVLERILKNENQNLKMQNQLLLSETHKLRKGNIRYREQWRKSALQLEQVRLECEAQKRRADEMKEIIMSRLAQLEGKISAGQSDNLGIECGNLLEALAFSESGLK